jgi:hypothetical protein
VKELCERSAVGVPEIPPLAAIDRPAGSDGLTERINGALPPEAAMGVNGTAWPCVMIVLATTVVAVIGESTVKLNVAVAIALLRSVAVTVKRVIGRVAEGVPEICPAEFMLRPAGSVGLTVRTKVPSPPAAVTGVKGDGLPCVIVVVGMTVVAVIAESTMRVNGAVAVAPLRSVAVTVKELTERVIVGVPEIRPLAAIDNPADSVGLTVKVKVPSPPVAVTGVKGVAWPCVIVVEGMAETATTALSTARLKLAVPVAPLASVTVIR